MRDLEKEGGGGAAGFSHLFLLNDFTTILENGSFARFKYVSTILSESLAQASKSCSSPSNFFTPF